MRVDVKKTLAAYVKYRAKQTNLREETIINYLIGNGIRADLSHQGFTESSIDLFMESLNQGRVESDRLRKKKG